MKLKGKATALQTEGRNNFLACLFLAGVDQARYGKVVDKLNNDHLQGSNCYPEDVPSMMALLNNRRGDQGGPKESNNVGDDSSVGSEKTVMSFLQEGRWCFCCGSKTHLASTCPDRSTTPRSEWFIKRKKQMQHFQSDESSQEGEDDDGGGITGKGVVGWHM
jgi:hypothetical protein